jgi:hypothetical protein
MDKPTTRRTALKTGLSLFAATGAAAVIAGTARAQSAKADPTTVAYQTKPSNGQQCSGCVQFVAPGSCQIVSGPIAPAGWCELYSPKS